MKSFTLISVAFISVACLTSCDSPSQKRKKDAQAVEITKLKGELAMLEERLNNLPPDRSVELAKAETEAAAQTEELKKLETEIADLEGKKKSIEKDLEEYKRKYVIR